MKYIVYRSHNEGQTQASNRRDGSKRLVDVVRNTLWAVSFRKFQNYPEYGLQLDFGRKLILCSWSVLGNYLTYRKIAEIHEVHNALQFCSWQFIYFMKCMLLSTLSFYSEVRNCWLSLCLCRSKMLVIIYRALMLLFRLYLHVLGTAQKFIGIKLAVCGCLQRIMIIFDRCIILKCEYLLTKGNLLL